MPSLAETQRAFAAALFSGSATLALHGARGLSGDDALAIYRHNLLGNYAAGLRASYPVITALLGEDCFQAVARDHARLIPSQSGDLNDYGADFWRTLATHAATTQIAYLPDVARLEWAIDVAQRAADARAFDPVSLGTLAPDQLGALCFQPHPSLQCLHFDWPALPIWQAHQPGASPEDLQVHAGSYHVMVLRSPHDHAVRALPMDTAEAVCLQALAAGETLSTALAHAQAHDAEFNLAEVLQRQVGLGSFSSWTIAGAIAHD